MSLNAGIKVNHANARDGWAQEQRIVLSSKSCVIHGEI